MLHSHFTGFRPRLSVCTSADAVPFRITRMRGNCQVVGNCVTDGVGNYDDNEDCRFAMVSECQFKCQIKPCTETSPASLISGGHVGTTDPPEHM